jgi:hypothetical protein
MTAVEVFWGLATIDLRFTELIICLVVFFLATTVFLTTVFLVKVFALEDLVLLVAI